MEDEERVLQVDEERVGLAHVKTRLEAVAGVNKVKPDGNTLQLPYQHEVKAGGTESPDIRGPGKRKVNLRNQTI